MGSDIFKNIVTFGAHSRVKKKNDELQQVKAELLTVHKRVERKKSSVNKMLLELVKTKTEALSALKKISKIKKNLQAKDTDFRADNFEKGDLDGHLESIRHTISLGEAAMNASKGVATGASTALGTWALVSTYGAASTGTAISTLSGAAATNATLAWLGGGSLAAGGGAWLLEQRSWAE